MRSIRAGSVTCFIGVLVMWLAAPTMASADDLAEGKAKSLACQACHVAPASTGDTPHLAGQRASYLARQLTAFKTGDRKHDLMSAIASQLSERDIENLAAYWSSQPAGSDTTVSDTVAAIKKSHMTFPRDFPNGYVLYHTAKHEEASGLSKSYVNRTALAAAKAGKPLPDGSAIIVVNYAAALDASKKPVVAKDGSWVPGKVLSYSGMEARAGWGDGLPELLRNANWNYALFTADKKPRAEINQAMCLACHKPTAATSYVFGWKDIQAAAGAR